MQIVNGYLAAIQPPLYSMGLGDQEYSLEYFPILLCLLINRLLNFIHGLWKCEGILK